MPASGSSGRQQAARTNFTPLTQAQAIGREQAPGYRGTELLRPVEAGGWWLTIDRWDTVAHFEAFQNDFGVQYRGLDEELEGVAGEEVFMGAFEE